MVPLPLGYVIAFYGIQDSLSIIISATNNVDFVVVNNSLGILSELFHVYEKNKKDLFEENVFKTYRFSSSRLDDNIYL